MLMAGEKRPRIGAIICGRLLPDGTYCHGVLAAYSSPALVTYCKCKACGKTRKVTRPQAG